MALILLDEKYSGLKKASLRKDENTHEEEK